MAYAEFSPNRGYRPAEIMSIERLLQERVFEPEIITVMTGAYEQARETLGLADRTDPATELLAQTVIAVVETGVRNPEQVLALTLAMFRRDGGGA